MKSRTKRWIFLVLSASAVLVLIGVAILFEPFAPRYQGRTVDQWLNFGAAEGEFHLGTNVISAFGPNALPTLLKATRERFWLRRVCRWSETVKADSLKRLLYKPVETNLGRRTTAVRWIDDLVRTDPALAENLLSRNPDDQFVVEMFRYFETAYMPDLLQRYASNPDPHVRNRARKLFKQYKNWNDITYQKWLEGQTNGTVANSN